ncbi:SAG family member [Eimeria mitis]|uniref:SAG family member n=1 Tax=Eimeria mitis TaxID=44415 RepID=U6JV45_9EIME|nr:SAG family member [Eimeria mitis]CDJ29304.1 SAG family member [Eimeria mitis]
MAPLYKAAAAFCLVGLSWLQSGANASTKYKFEVAELDEDAYLTVKLVRNGKISSKTNGVEKDDQLATTLQGKVESEHEDEQPTCASLITAEHKKIFYHTFDYEASPDYRKLFQEALKTGLDAIGTTYPTAWQDIWTKENARNLLHLLGASSTKVGCVLANCVKKDEPLPHAKSDPEAPTKSVLFCELAPPATANDAAFSEEYFNELIARKDELKSMTEEDLKDPIVTSSADVAVPSILTAGLVAILAAISA